LNIHTAIRQGTELVGSRLTAEVLLAHAMKCERIYFHAHPEQELKEVEWLHYGRYLHESMKGKPTQYITHKQEFYGRDFRVTPDVLIPRPETELLVEAVLKLRPGARTIIDVGTGSGAIAITLALDHPQTRGGYTLQLVRSSEARLQIIATDISRAALTVAANNAQSLNAPVQFITADLLTPFQDEAADAIVSNPPYIGEADRGTLQPQVRDWEPSQALFAGPTGMAIYERLIPDAKRVLKSGGLLALEIGFGQAAAVSALAQGWQKLQILPDLAGIPRVLVCEKP
jgi:release factor glutamine methyltransferase